MQGGTENSKDDIEDCNITKIVKNIVSRALGESNFKKKDTMMIGSNNSMGDHNNEGIKNVEFNL